MGRKRPCDINGGSSQEFGIFENKSLDKRKYLLKIRILLANYHDSIVMVTFRVLKTRKRNAPQVVVNTHDM